MRKGPTDFSGEKWKDVKHEVPGKVIDGVGVEDLWRSYTLESATAIKRSGCIQFSSGRLSLVLLESSFMFAQILQPAR